MGAFIDNELADRFRSHLPYSHSAGYEACPRTALVAGTDLRPDVLAAFGRRYRVPPEHLYDDHRQMIRTERPDILSIATQPQHRTEIALFAIEHGVRALYCEKPLCASLAEADELLDAVERSGVVFAMGTNRRWDPGYDAARAAIASGDLGSLGTLVTFHRCTLFNTATHWFDLMLSLNRDVPVAWVQAYLANGDSCIEGDEVIADPLCEGTIAFANEVMAHLIATPQGIAHEAICQRGTIRMTSDDARFEVHHDGSDGNPAAGCPPATLDYTPGSSTLRLIEDLVHALDTGVPTRSSVRIAHLNTQLLFAFLESHRSGGCRVALPLRGSSLRFVPRNTAPRQPRYEA
jgi:predicted dehydrogenase